MKKKTALLGMLSLSLAASITASAAAPVETTEPTTTPVIISAQQQQIDPLAQYAPSMKFVPMAAFQLGLDTSFDTKDGFTHKFTIDPGYGHFATTVYNRGTTSFEILLEHKDSGLFYMTEVVDPGAKLEWKSFDKGYPQGMRGGEYNLRFKGDSNNPVGIAYVKTATAVNDL